MNYQDLVDETARTEFRLLKYGKGLRMAKHENPASIAEPEFKFIKEFVEKNKLKRGYEVATAFGISMLAAAVSFKKNGGKLVTMDAYIEEQYNDCAAYDNVKKVTYEDSDGYKTAQFLIKTYGLENTVTPVVGFSPNDTKSALEITFDLTKEKLDYAFIDALHTEEAVIRDIEAVLPYLDKRYVLFLHDVHCFPSGRVQRYLLDKFGTSWSIVPGCEHPGNGYNLAMINKL